MALSRRQWHEVAEEAAAAHYGRKYAGLFMSKRFLAGPAAVAGIVGAVGYGAYWLWGQAARVVSAPSVGASVPIGMVVAAALLFLVTIVAFRPGRPPARGATMVVKASAVSLAWLGLLAFGIGTLI